MSCTIACDQGHLTAHKEILCQHSKYLEDILMKYPDAEHPIIILTEPNLIDVKILVNYMYTGQLLITNDSSPTNLLRAAQILKIDSLINLNDDDEDEEIMNEKQQIDFMNSIRSIYNLDQLQSTTTTTSPTTSLPQQPQQPQQPPSPPTQKIIQDNKNNKIRCHLCNINLSDVKCLYRHVLTRHLPEKWGYKCEFCDREFSRDDHLMRHYATKHKNMEFNREKIRETRRLNREMAKNFHDQISTN